jgi:hypothetical protein
MDCGLAIRFQELRRLSSLDSFRIVIPAISFWLLFSKQRHIILSLWSMTSMLTRTLHIRASRSHHYQRHFHVCTQTHLERSAVRLAHFGPFKLDCICREATNGEAVLIMMTDGARLSKKLKCETVLAWNSVNRSRIRHISLRISLCRILEIQVLRMCHIARSTWWAKCFWPPAISLLSQDSTNRLMSDDVVFSPVWNDLLKMLHPIEKDALELFECHSIPDQCNGL